MLRTLKSWLKMLKSISSLLLLVLFGALGHAQSIIQFTENPWEIIEACVDCGTCDNGMKSEKVTDEKSIAFYCDNKLIGHWIITKELLTACKKTSYQLSNSKDDRQHANMKTLEEVVDVMAMEVRGFCNQATEITNRNSEELEVAELMVARFFTVNVPSQYEGPIFRVTEEMPHIAAPACEKDFSDPAEIKKCYDVALLEFVYKNLRYPKEALNKRIEGVVLIGYTVETDGTLTNIIIKKDIGGGCGQEGKRLVELTQTERGWAPGYQKGKAVRVGMVLPVKFKLK